MSELYTIKNDIYCDDIVGVDEGVINFIRLTEAYRKCRELQNTSSTILKQEMLSECRNDETFKQILKFLLNPNIVTGINKKKIEKKVDAVRCDFTTIIQLMDYLKEHNTGTDKDIACCQAFLNYWSDDYLDQAGEEDVEDGFYSADTQYDNQKIQDFIKSIITKSLKLGVDVKTVNKVYGKDFIPVLNVMLGTSVEKCKIPEGTWFAISQKLNGSRCFYYKGKLYTRQGKIYTGCEHIIKDIENLTSKNRMFVEPVYENYVFDGELILKDNSLSDSEAFQKGVGIANSDKENKQELKLVIFDMLNQKEFEFGESIYLYKRRKEQLNDLRNLIADKNLSNIEVVPMFYEGTDQSEIWKWLDYAEENDMEGVMINLDTPYECKRTKNLIKVKKFYTLDLKVINAVEGDGRLKGTLGALVVDYKGNTVNVGSGFSDKQRKEFWENKESIIGRVIEVKYKEITKNKDTSLESLQFPVFVSLREQGKEVSYD